MQLFIPYAIRRTNYRERDADPSNTSRSSSSSISRVSVIIKV